MIQRRVKWKKGVAVENGCMQAGKGLGNSRKAGDGALGGEGMGCCPAVYFKAWRGSITQR